MRTLIVEEDAGLAAFVALSLQEDGHVTDICTSSGGALSSAELGLYRLIVTDASLPDEAEGTMLVRELRRRCVTAPILMLVSPAMLHMSLPRIELPVDDFLVKPFVADELKVRTQLLLRRRPAHGSLGVGELEIDPLRHRMLVQGHPVDLSAREYELLMLLMRHADEILSRAQLLAQVWDIGRAIESNLVENVISRLRFKLGRAAWMIETVHGQGYRLRSK
jgi:DNA-binding response OmpR family regulator